MSEPTLAGTGRDRLFDATAAITGLATAAIAIAFGIGIGGAENARDLSNWLQVIAPALACALCVLASHRSQSGGWRIGWLLIGASCGLWGIGQVIWTWLETLQGQVVPFPSIADAFYLLSVPVAIAGLLSFPSSPANRSGRARTLLDGFIVASSVLFVSWVFVLGPTLADGGGTPLERAIGLAYPAGDVVLLTIVIIAAVRCDPAGRISTSFVAAGFSAFAVADSVFAYTALHTDTVSEISNTAWVVGYLLVALGALHAARHPPDVGVENEPRSSWITILMPYGPVAIVLLVSVVEASVNETIVVDDIVFWIGVVLISLLLVRQGVVILENVRLARSLELSNEGLQYRVLHDTLTDLPNRPLFMDRLRVVLARMTRVEEVVAVMFIDLDRFKPINDEHGHEAGDAVLAGVAVRMTAALRAGDTVARYGGDEFLVLCEGVSGVDEAVMLAQRVVDTVAEPLAYDGHQLVVSASLGMIVTDTPILDAEELIGRADAAMYLAKSKGRARIEMVDGRAPLAAPGGLGRIATTPIR